MDELETLVARYGVKQWVENTHALIAVTRSDGQLLACNAAFAYLRAKQSPIRHLRDFIHKESQPLVESYLHGEKETNAPLHLLLEIQSRVALYRCWLISIPEERFLFFAEPVEHDPNLAEKYQQLLKDHRRLEQALHRKEVELKGVIAQAHEISHTDALTYLPNRRKILGDLQHEVLRTNRYHTPLSIAILDIDHFKIINDRYGHPVGDKVLHALASELREQVRESDLVGRIGGEEFLIVLPNTDLKAASEQADRLCKHIRQLTIPHEKHTLRITVSIGITEYLIEQENWQALLGRADQALYCAKNNGRDRWYALPPQGDGSLTRDTKDP